MTRAVVIGARRRRQGIGPYVARSLAELGVDVCGIVGTQPETVEAARADLRERFEIDCAGYTDVESALCDCAPDLVAICSPHALHREHLGLAVAAGVHAVCEKPLWWEEGDRDRGAAAGRIADAFAQRGRHLGLLAQWPCILPAYRDLFPVTRDRLPERFEMKLAPAATGRAAVVDVAPHALAVLERLVGPGAVLDARADAGTEGLILRFRYVHASGAVDSLLRILACPEPPRPSGLGLDGCWAERAIDPQTWAMRLTADDGRWVPLPDPTPLRLAEILAAIRAGAPPDRAALVAGVEGLERLACAVG